MKAIIANVVHAMEAQPLALALVIVNALFLAAGLYVMTQISKNSNAEDAQRMRLIEQLLTSCLGKDR